MYEGEEVEGTEPWNEFQLQERFVKPETKYATRDQTTAFFGKERLELHREGMTLLALFDSKKLEKPFGIILNILGADAALTKGLGNTAIVMTNLAAWRFKSEDILKAEEEGIAGKVEDVIKKLRRI